MGESIDEVEHQIVGTKYYRRPFDVATQSFIDGDVGDSYRQWDDVLHGSKNPYRRAQISALQNASTSVTRLFQTIALKPDRSYYSGWTIKPPPPDGTLSPFYRAETTFGYGVTHFGVTSFGLPNPESQSSTTSYNQATSDLYSQIDSIMSGVNLGETVGEMRETLGTLRRPLNSLRQLLTTTITRGYQIARGIRGGRIPVSKIPKVIGDTYLEFRFGWNPLVSDIAKTYVEMTTNRMGFKAIPISSRGRYYTETISPTVYGGSGITYWAVTERNGIEQKYRYKGVICVDPTSSISGGGPTWGALPSQYPATIWNLIPWSFVADYFFNVGDMIQSVCTPWPKFVYLDAVIERNCYRKYDIQPYTNLGDFGGMVQTSDADSGVVVVQWKSLQRSPVSGKPYVQPELNIPDMGSRPWYNLGAMALSASEKVGRALVDAWKGRR
jgi:hypothetical protein